MSTTPTISVSTGATTTTDFPEGYFFIKNQANQLVVSVERDSTETGGFIVIESLKKKGYDSQLWSFESGVLRNKRSKFALGVDKGSVKFNVETIQTSKDAEVQEWALGEEGHIYIKSKPAFVIGIKDSFFGKKEGSRLHIQERKKNTHKEQRWDFVIPIVKPKVTETLAEPKPVLSPSSVEAEEGKWPESWCFIKNQDTEQYLSIEGHEEAGTRVYLERFNKKDHASQLWKWDNGFVINKRSGNVLDINRSIIRAGTDIVQFKAKSTDDAINQVWGFNVRGNIYLKAKRNFVLSVHDGYFSSARAIISEVTREKKQKWAFVVPVYKKKTGARVWRIGYAQFPTGVFFLKYSKELVLDVETKDAQSKVIIRKLDIAGGGYKSQLWRYKNGYLVNELTGYSVNAKELADGAKNYQIAGEGTKFKLLGDGTIVSEKDETLVFSVDDNADAGTHTGLRHKDKVNEATRKWSFFIPVFGKRKTQAGVEEDVVESTDEVKDLPVIAAPAAESAEAEHEAEHDDEDAIDEDFADAVAVATETHQDASTIKFGKFPAREFFLKWRESDLVVDYDQKTNRIVLNKLNLSAYKYQLWTYEDGHIVNWTSKFVLDLEKDEITSGMALYQKSTNTESQTQRWAITIDGAIFSGANPDLHFGAKDGDNLFVHSKEELVAEKSQRWSFLIPVYTNDQEHDIDGVEEQYNTVENEVITAHKQVITTVYKFDVISFPDQPFFLKWISFGENLVLSVEESSRERNARIILQVLNPKSYKCQLWTFKNGFLVNAHSGHVLNVKDSKLVPGSLLTQVEEKTGSEAICQHWGYTSDGIVFVQGKDNLALIGNEKESLVKLQNAAEGRSRIKQSWSLIIPHFKRTQSTLHVQEFKTMSPEYWFFLRWNNDLVWDVKNGQALFSKQHTNDFDSQLWAYRDGYLINKATKYVLAVEGNNVSNAHLVLVAQVAGAKNQHWLFADEGYYYSTIFTNLAIGAPKENAEEGTLLTLVDRKLIMLIRTIFLRFDTGSHSGHAEDGSEPEHSHDLLSDSASDISFHIHGPGKGFNFPASNPPVVVVAQASEPEPQSDVGIYEEDEEGPDETKIAEPAAPVEIIDTNDEPVNPTEKLSRPLQELEQSVITRYKPQEHSGHFPDQEFFIKNNLQGYALEALDDGTVALRKIRSKDFLAQLWVYRDGWLVNQKTHHILDVPGNIESGKELYMTEPRSNHNWATEAVGFIFWQQKHGLVLGIRPHHQVKDEKVPVYLTDRKHLDHRDEHQQLRWTFLIPIYEKKKVSKVVGASTAAAADQDKKKDATPGTALTASDKSLPAGPTARIGEQKDAEHPLAKAATSGTVIIGTGEVLNVLAKPVRVNADEIKEETIEINGKPVKRYTWWNRIVDATKDGAHYVVTGVETGVENVVGPAVKGTSILAGDVVGVVRKAGQAGGWLIKRRGPKGEIIEEEIKTEDITEKIYTGPDGTHWIVAKDQVVDEKDIVEKEVIGPDGKKTKRLVWFGKIVDATKNGGKYVVHGIGDAIEMSENGLKVVAKDTGNVIKDVAIGTAIVGVGLGVGAYELARTAGGWVRRKRGPKGEIIEEKEIKKEEIIETDTAYKAPDGDVYTAVDKTVKEEDIKEEIVIVNGKPVKRFTWLGRVVDATKNGANYTIHGVGDIVHDAADGTKKVTRGVGDLAKDLAIGAVVGTTVLGVGAYELVRGHDGWHKRKLSPDGKTVITEEKVDVKDIAAGPSKYLSPDGSAYIVSNETVSEKDLVEETVVINGKPVRRWTWLGRIVDVTKDGAKFIVHGVGDMVVSAADGTRMVAQDAGALAKGTGNLAKNIVIGTAVVAGAAGLGAVEFVRGHSGLYQRKPSPDGKTIIEEKVEISKVPKDTLYLGPDGEKYVSKNEEVLAKDIVEETVVVGGQPVKKLTWLGKVVDATKNGANYVVHGVGDVITTTEGGVKTVAKDTGKVALGLGALGFGAYELVRGPKGWSRKKQGPKGEVIVEEVKAEEITESVYTAPDGSTYLVAKDQVVDVKDVVEKDVIGPDGKKSKRFVWFGKLVDATKNDGKYIIHGVGDAVQKSEDGLKVVAKDTGNVIKDVAIGTAIVGVGLGVGAYELARTAGGWVRRKRGPKGEIIEEKEIKKEEVIETETTYKAPDGDVYTAVNKTVKQEDIKEEIIEVDGKPIKRFTWLGRVVDATKSGANYTIHGVGDVVQQTANGTKKVARGVGTALGAYELVRGHDGWHKRKLSPDGKTVVTEEKVDVKDIVAGPSSKYLSPDGSAYIVSNETVSEKDLVEETVVINGKPVRRWTWLGRIVDVTKDGAKFIVHGVGDMVVSAADGTRMVAQDAGALAKGTGNLAKNVVIGTAVVAGAAGLGAVEFVRGHSGLYQRKPSPDGKTIIEEKVEISKVPKDTLYFGPDGEEYVSKNEEVPAKDIVEETVVVGDQPVKKLTWLGKVVDATKNGANYVVHGVGGAITTEGGVKTVAKDTGKIAAVGLVRGPKGWLRKKQGPKGEVIVEEVKAEEITESVYTAPDGSTYIVAKDQVVDEKDVVEKDVIGPDGKKSKRFVWFGKLVDATKNDGKYIIHGVGDAVQKSEDGLKVVAKDTGNVIKDVAIGTAIVGVGLGVGAYELARTAGGWVRRKRGPKGEIIEEKEIKKEEVIETETTYKAPDGDVYTAVNKTVKQEDIKEEIIEVDGKPIKRFTWLGRVVDATKSGANYTIHGVGDVVHQAAGGTKKVTRGVGDVIKDAALTTALGVGGAAALIRSHTGWYSRKPSPDGRSVIEEKVESKDVKQTQYLGPDGEVYSSPKEPVDASKVIEETVIVSGKPQKRLTLLGRLVDATKDGANYVVHGVGDVVTTTENGVKTVAKDTGKVAKDAAIGSALGLGALGFGAYELVRGPKGWSRKKQGPKGEVIVEEVKAEEITESVYTAPDGSTYLVAKDQVVDVKDVVEKDVIGPDGKKSKRFVWFGKLVDATKNDGKYIIHGVGDAVQKSEDGLKVVAKDTGNVIKDVAIGTAIVGVGLGVGAYELARTAGGWVRRKRGPKGEIIEEKEIKKEEVIETETTYKAPDGDVYTAVNKTVKQEDIKEEIIEVDGKPIKRFTWLGRVVDATKSGANYTIHGVGDVVQQTANGPKKVARGLAIGTAVGASALGLGAYEVFRGAGGLFRHKPSPDGKTIIEEKIKPEDAKDVKYYGPDGEAYSATKQVVPPNEIIEETLVVDGMPKRRQTWFGKVVDASKEDGNYVIHGVGEAVTTTGNGVRTVAKDTGNLALGAGALAHGTYDLVRGKSGWKRLTPTPDGKVVEVEVKSEEVEVKDTKYHGPDGEVYKTTQEEVKSEDIVEETVIVNGKPQRRYTWHGKILDATKEGGKYIVHGVGDAVTTTENGVKVVATESGKLAKDVAIGTAVGIGALGLGTYELLRSTGGMIRRKLGSDGKTVIEEEVKTEQVKNAKYHGPDGDVYTATDKKVSVDEVKEDIIVIDGKPQKRLTWLGSLVDATKDGGNYVIHGVGDVVSATGSGVKTVAKDTGNVAKGAGNILKDTVVGTIVGINTLGLGAYDLIRGKSGWKRLTPTPDGKVVEVEVKSEEVEVKDTKYRGPDGEVYETTQKEVKSEDVVEETVVVNGKPQRRYTWLGNVLDATKVGGNFIIHGVGDVITTTENGVKIVVTDAGKLAKGAAVGTAVGVGALGLGTYELLRSTGGMIRRTLGSDGKTVIEEKVKPEDVKNAKYYGPDGDVYAAAKREVPANQIKEETVVVDGKPQKRLTWLGNVVDATEKDGNYVIHGIGNAIKTTKNGVKGVADDTSNVAKGAVIGAAVEAETLVRGNKGFVRRKPTVDGLVIEEEVKVDEIKETTYYGPDGELYERKKEEIDVKSEDVVEETVIINGKPQRRLTWLGKIVDATKEGGNYVIHGVGDVVETTANGTRVVARGAGNIVKDLAIGTVVGVGMAGYGLFRGFGGGWFQNKSTDGKIVEEEVKKEDVIANKTESVRYYGPDGDVYAVTHQDAPVHEVLEETVVIDGKPQKRLTWYGKLVDATKEGGNYVIHGVGDAISTTENGVKTVVRAGAVGLGTYELFRINNKFVRGRRGPNGEIIDQTMVSKDEKITKTVYSTPDGSQWIASSQEVDEKEVVEKDVILPNGTKVKRFVWFGKLVDATKDGGKYVIHGIGDTVVATENGVKVVGKDASDLAKNTAGGVIAGATGFVRGLAGWLRPTTTPTGEVIHEEVKKEEVIEADTIYKAPDGDVYTVVDKTVKEEDIKKELVVVDGKPVLRLTWLGRLVDATKQGGDYVIHGVGDAIHETANGTKTAAREVGDVAKDASISAAVGAHELVRHAGGWYQNKPTPDGKRELVKINTEEVANKGPGAQYYGPDGGVYAAHNQPVKANEIIEEDVIIDGKPQKRNTWFGHVVDATKDGADYVVHGVGDVVHTTTDGTKVVAKDAGNLAKDIVVGSVIGAGALGLGGYELIRHTGGWAKRKLKPDGKIEVLEVKDYTSPDGDVFVAYNETVPENQIKEEIVEIDGKSVKRKTWLGRIVDASKDGTNYVVHGVGDIINTTENGAKKVGRDVTTVAKDAALLGAGAIIAGGVGAYEIVRGLGGWYKRRNGPNGEVIVEEIKDEKIITDTKEYKNPDGETYEIINREVDDKDIIVEEVVGVDGKPTKQKTWLGHVVDTTKVGANWIVHGAKKTPVWSAGGGGTAGRAPSLDQLRVSGRQPSKSIVSPTETQTLANVGTASPNKSGSWLNTIGKSAFAAGAVLGNFGINEGSSKTPSTIVGAKSVVTKEDTVFAAPEDSEAGPRQSGTIKTQLGSDIEGTSSRPLIVATLAENLPAHFGNVKAYLFDVFTLVDWKASIAAELETLAKSVNVTTSHDWKAFAVKWKAGFDTEVNRIVRFQKDSTDYQKSDIILRTILDKLLVEYGLNSVLREQQIAHLNLVWHRLNLHDDTQKSVQRIKEKYIAATFSNLSFRTLVDLARHCSICWNANISTELFDNYKPDPEAYEMAAEILSLDPNQIAIVSYDIVDLQAAKKAGFATIFTSRQVETEKIMVTEEVDVVVQNLDGLITISEKGFAKEVVTTTAPEKKGWLQYVVDTTKQVATATAGTISDISEDVVELATGRGHEETEKY